MAEKTKELALWLALSFLPKVGSAELRWLISQFGDSPYQLLSAPIDDLKRLSLPESALQAFIQWQKMGEQSDIARKAAVQYEFAEQARAHIIALNDSRYPEALKQIHDAPLVLYVKGDIKVLNRSQVAVVGSRKPSVAGQRIAFQLAADLAFAGYGVTSGLALGIDAAAHKGALTTGATIAVMATGLDQIYPRAHQELAEQIMQSGVIISEFAFGTSIRRYNFPKRNRLISGLSLGVLVVEAALKSGSLITARFALEHNREVFAVPGSVLNPLSRGCHALIKDGALLVENADDVLSNFNQKPLFCASGAVANKQIALSTQQQQVLAKIGFEPIALEALVGLVGLQLDQLMEELVKMELEGFIVCEAGAYQRTGLAP